MVFGTSLRAWRGALLGFLVVSFAGVSGLAEWLTRIAPRWPAGLLTVLLVAGGAAQSFWLDRAVFFELSPAQACRRIYGANPFPESMEIARFLREHTAPDARLVVFGSEPQILFCADRRSATPFLYVYPLVEAQPYAAPRSGISPSGLRRPTRISWCWCRWTTRGCRGPDPTGGSSGGSPTISAGFT
jgi:hypothetical protein